MGQLYLIRHGKTALNGPHGSSGTNADRIRGWKDIPLDAQGLAQARRLGLMFESKGLDCLYSSDLSRAAVTADAIAAKSGIKNCPELAFRPWNLGDFQGQESADVAPLIKGFVVDTPTIPVPNGESFQDFKARYLPAFEKLLDEAKAGKTVGLVTHYRCVKLAEAWLANGQADALTIEPQEFLKADLEPADVLCVYFDAPNGKWQVEPEDDSPTAGEDMKDKQILCEITAPLGDDNRQRIQVFPGPGDYVHPKGNRKFTLTTENLQEFADNINATDTINVDRDHAFYKGLSAPAAGWFVPGTATVDADGTVNADVEWTPKAAQQVRDGEYRFISPEFSFAKRKMDGNYVPEPTLHAATLTNRPFFEGMAPVAAEDIPLADELLVADAFGEDVADSLDGMAADAVAGLVAAAWVKVGPKKGQAANTAGSSYADPGYQADGQKRYALDSQEEVQAAARYIGQKKNAARYTSAQLKRIKARIQRAAKKFGVTIGADDHEGGTGMDLTAELADKLGIAADASEDEVAEAIANLAAENATLKETVEKAPDADSIKTLIADAQKGVEASNALALMKRDKSIDDAIEEGKIVPAEKATYEGFWAIDPDGTEKLLAEKPVAVPFAASGKTNAAVYDAAGNALKGGDGEGALVADLADQMVDGIPTPVDEDSARLHAAAEAHLAANGKAKGSYTEDEYLVACEAVLPTLGISR